MSKAFYFDGQSPVSIEGSLNVENDRLIFQSVGQKKDFGVIEIRSLEILGNEYVLVLKDQLHSSSKIVFYDSELKKVIEKEFLNQHNFFYQFAHNVHHLNFVKALGLTLAIVPPAAMLLFLGFTNLYKLVPETWDKHLGERTYEYIVDYYGKCGNNQTSAILKKMTKSLTENETVDVQIVHSDIVNAFAFPGGKILIFDGLLKEAQSPEEVYGILAHEIAHVEKRHSIQQMFRLMGISVVSSLIIGGTLDKVEALENFTEMMNVVLYMKYSRGFEEEADAIALKKLAKNKVSMQGLADFFLRHMRDGEVPMQDKKVKEIFNWLSSHPDSENRLQMIQDKISQRKYRPIRVLKRKEWKKLKLACSHLN